MSINKETKANEWDRKRNRPGPKPGTGKKTKISVSVDERNWNNALAQWKDKGSQLVDRLIWRYVDTGGKIIIPEGVI